MEVRPAQGFDVEAVVALTAGLGTAAGPLVRSHLDRHHLLVADLNGEVVGVLAYRTDWFECTFVTMVPVREDHRKRGVARALYRAVEDISPGPRLSSSTEETNAISIQMHTALGFQSSGHIDNLPQGYRELLFFRSLRP